MLSFRLQGDYEIKDFIFGSQRIPKFMQAGLYKIIIMLYQGNKLTSGVVAFMTLS